MSIAKIKTYLNQPAAADKSIKESIKVGAIISIAVGLLVYLFFLQNSTLSLSQKIGNSIAFSLITFGVGISTDLFFYKVFPNWMAEKNWTVGKSLFYIFLNFMTIALANYFFMIYQGYTSYSVQNFIYMIGSTFLIGSIPLTFTSLYRHNQKLKKSLAEAQKLNQQLSLSHQVKSPPSSTTFVKLSTNTDPSKSNVAQKELAIDLEDFLFAVSEKNYVRFVFNEADDLQIRATIKAIEKQFANTTEILRTHRAFIINTKKISNVEGNAQGYRLSFDGTEELALVSRSYVKGFKLMMNYE